MTEVGPGLLLAGFLLLVLAASAGLKVLLPLIRQHLKGGGGWRRLATAYASRAPPPAPVLQRQTLQVGTVLYKNCVNIGISDAGLHLALTGAGAMLKLGPLLIPWREIRRIGDAKLFWQQASVLWIGEPELGSITVMASQFDVMRPWLAELPRTPARV